MRMDGATHTRIENNMHTYYLRFIILLKARVVLHTIIDTLALPYCSQLYPRYFYECLDHMLLQGFFFTLPLGPLHCAKKKAIHFAF
jgi:hypothetical protein